jgi:hypothetical protein
LWILVFSQVYSSQIFTYTLWLVFYPLLRGFESEFIKFFYLTFISSLRTRLLLSNQRILCLTLNTEGFLIFSKPSLALDSYLSLWFILSNFFFIKCKTLVKVQFFVQMLDCPHFTCWKAIFPHGIIPAFWWKSFVCKYTVGFLDFLFCCQMSPSLWKYHCSLSYWRYMP